MHSGLKRYNCQSYSGTALSDVSMLKNILEKHPYECGECGKTFFRVSSLTNMLNYTLERNHTSVMHVVKRSLKSAK